MPNAARGGRSLEVAPMFQFVPPLSKSPLLRFAREGLWRDECSSREIKASFGDVPICRISLSGTQEKEGLVLEGVEN